MNRHTAKLTVNTLEDRLTPAGWLDSFTGPVLPPEGPRVLVNPVSPPIVIPPMNDTYRDTFTGPRMPPSIPVSPPHTIQKPGPIVLADPDPVTPTEPVQPGVSHAIFGVIESIRPTSITVRSTPDNVFTLAIDSSALIMRNYESVRIEDVLGLAVGEHGFVSVNANGQVTGISIQTPEVVNPDLESSVVTGTIMNIHTLQILVSNQSTTLTTLQISPKTVVTRNGVATTIAEVASLAWYEQIRATVNERGIVTRVEITSGIDYKNPQAPHGQYYGTVEAVGGDRIRIRISESQVYDLKVSPLGSVTLNALETPLANVPESVVGSQVRITLRQRGFVQSVEILTDISDSVAVDPAPNTYLDGTVLKFDVANNVLYIRDTRDVDNGIDKIYRVRVTSQTLITMLGRSNYSSFIVGGTTVRLSFAELAAQNVFQHRLSIGIGDDGTALGITDPILISA